jgi:hypothetical protein
MRSDDDIRERLDELYVKRLRERRERYCSKCHMNCAHNKRQKVKGKGTVSFCTNIKILKSKKRPVFVCDDEETVNQCRLYEPAHTEDSVKEDFDNILKSPSLCGQDYPKMAILIWCLQDAKIKSRIERVKSIVERIFRNLLYLVSCKWW